MITALDIVLRPAVLDDATFVADAETARRPDKPVDPVLLRHWWENEEPDWTTERYIIERGGRRIGAAHMRHAPWSKMPERFASVGGDYLPQERTADRLHRAFERMEERAIADGAGKLTTFAWEDDALRIRVVGDRGFKEERRGRFWELDLDRHRERLARMAEESRRKVRAEGIRVVTLDEAEREDAEVLRKIWRMNLEAERDVPTTVPIVAESFEMTEKWLRGPGLRPDRIWLALLDGDVVGVSMLSYPPVRGFVMTDWTGTSRRVRGKGVARALKCETVLQAIALGVDRVRTDNDGQNDPILHINETMGYERIVGSIQFLKVLVAV